MPLSRQELVDCVKPNSRPHITSDAFSYISNNGVTFDEEYPSIYATKGKCKRVRKQGPIVTTILDYKLLQPDDEENLKTAVALIGPISVSIKVTHKFFFFTGTEFSTMTLVQFDTWQWTTLLCW